MMLLSSGRPASTAVAPNPWAAWPLGRASAEGAGAAREVAAEIVGLNGSMHRVLLQSLDLAQSRAMIRLTPGGSVVPMRFDHMRSLSLATLVDAADELSSTQADADGGPCNFRIEFNDGRSLTGQALMFTELVQGVLVLGLSESGRHAKHTLYFRAGFRHAQRLVDASPLRLRGVLQGQQVWAPDQLPMALQASAQLALTRLGSTMVALGYLGEDQLAAALEVQQRSPDLPLGEVLIREGYITREQQRVALAHKMGHPIVDLERFPVDVAALRCLPLAAAQSFEALPICFLGRQLVVVTGATLRPESHKELSFLCQRTLVTALPKAGIMARHIEDQYDRHGLGGPQWLDLN